MSAAHRKPNSAKPSRRRLGRTPARPYVALPVVAFCGLLVAAGIQFGNPLLWADANQPHVEPDAVQPELEPEPQLADDPLSGLSEIGSYQAVSQSDNENRIVNIRIAAEAIDGAIIQPGETFSFNERVGDTSEDERYLDAPVIAGGDMVDGRGGGICQVSTALYIATLKANLDVVERHSHSLVSDYAPIGLDATLVYGIMDLRIANTTDTPIVIKAEPKGQSVTVSLWGAPLPEGFSIDAVSKITDRYERDGTGEPEEGFAEAHAGTFYVAESYRVFYQDGIKTSSELLAIDTYKVSDNEPVRLIEGSVAPSK